MACCAFAAFLISQIIFGLDWARERLGLADHPSGESANAAVAWRLDGAATAAPRRGRSARDMIGGRVGMAAAGGGAAFVLLAALTLRVEAGPHAWDVVTLICTGHGLERLANLRGG